MRAEEGSRDMPALQAMILNDVVWVTVPSLDFQGATRALAPLLASSNQTPYHSVYAYEAALSLLVSTHSLVLCLIICLVSPRVKQGSGSIIGFARIMNLHLVSE